MKKTILSVTLVLLLGWVLISCEPPSEYDNNLPDDLKQYLGTSLANAIKLPADTNFDDWWSNGNMFYIAWKDADETKWADYVKAWGVTSSPSARAASNSLYEADVKGKISSGVSMAMIFFHPDEGNIMSTTLDLSANSIVFGGIKTAP